VFVNRFSWEAVLSPLESACEDVKKKTSQLLKAVELNPPDLRMLQVNLQGAVLTAVNQVRGLHSHFLQTVSILLVGNLVVMSFISADK